MTIDRYGLDTSATDPVAVAAFADAVHGVAAHRPTAGAALGRALAADPDFVAAHTLKGFANLILAREELVPAATTALADARSAAQRRPASADEDVLVAALSDALDGRFAGAAHRLERGFAGRPTTLLPFKLAHSLRFMIGDASGMLAASDRMLAAWQPDEPAAGFLLGCHAFGLEEHGEYAAAERFGRRAVALAPEDAWGQHAVGHVFEMRGDTDAGIAWLEEGRGTWSRCNNFSFHMAWHLALLLLERRDTERVLDVYDAEVRPVQTDDFRDVANAVSLLWRLDRSGIDVGRRWDDLAEIARRRRTDTTLVFASLHTLIALVAVGDHAGAADMTAALALRAAEASEQGRVAARVGLPLARVITGMAGRSRGPALDRLALDLHRLGGSNAQRDLFVLLLAEAAGRTGDTAAQRAIDTVRHRLKTEDRLIAAVCGREPHLVAAVPHH